MFPCEQLSVFLMFRNSYTLLFPLLQQVDNAKVLHYIGVVIAFPTSTLFVGLQTALTYRLARYIMAHLRLCMALLAFVALVLNGVFFCGTLESFTLQHASAIFEWVFCVTVMLFYGTFAFEFAGISRVSMVMVSMGGGLRDIGTQTIGDNEPTIDLSNQ
uniref:CWH43-like N-terminal domain-containing protein n=1 Tax=Gouania willdenowi TaxID=441366 RepID=A0A8C5HVV2_GOUWI